MARAGLREIFFVLYIVMWIVVPFGPEPADGAEGQQVAGRADPVTGWNARPRRAARRSGSGSWIFGLVLLGVILLYGAIRRRPA